VFSLIHIDSRVVSCVSHVTVSIILTSLLALMSSRTKRRENLDEAYRLQQRGAIIGGTRWTIGGIGAATIAHYSWPAFRRHTLPFKAFLVSFCTIFGLVTGAETELLSHERYQRVHESAIRTEARLDLARRGLVPTETEIMKWREEHDKT